MSKRLKLFICVIFAVLIAAAMVVILLNVRETQEGSKEFKIEISSERDGFYEIKDLRTDFLFLGEYLRTMEECQYDESEWGLFITGFYGMEHDFSDEYWWFVSVNGEGALAGVDDIPIIDGDVFSFALIQGY